MPNLKFLASTVPEILRGSQTSKNRSRDPFYLILHFFVRTHCLSSPCQCSDDFCWRTSNNHTVSGTTWIQFDDSHVGTQARTDNQSWYTPSNDPRWTRIRPKSRQFQVCRSQSNQVLRKQFPLRQSSAKTTHRSQGHTLDEVVVDMSRSRREPHVHYVALSRVRSLRGLFVLNL